MQKVSLLKVQSEVKRLEKSVAQIQKVLTMIQKNAIIIEKLDERELTSKERKALRSALNDLKKGRGNKFVSLSDLKSGL